MPSRARLATVVVAGFWSSANEAGIGINFTAARSQSTLDTVYSLGNLYDAQCKFPTTDMNVVTNPDVNDRDNSFQVNGNPANIIAQLLAQTLFGMRPVIDFKEVAQEVVCNARGRWDTITKEWDAYRIPNT